MRDFTSYIVVPYIGQPQAYPIKLVGIAGQQVPLHLDWLSYGVGSARPNVNIAVDLRRKECEKLVEIRSVYIDNLGSNVPIYVSFPNNAYVVVAKPNSEGWYPVFSADKVAVITGLGFSDADVLANATQSTVIFSNIIIQPDVNVEIDNAVALWKASPLITRGNNIYNATYGIPALGDQTEPHNDFITGTGVLATNLWQSPYASGFIYLNAISIKCNNIQPVTGTLAQFSFVIESTGISGTLYSFSYAKFASYGGDVVAADYEFIQMSGMQLKLDATETWRLRVGFYQNMARNPLLMYIFNYTVSD